jgi:hypothetical protein
VSHHCHALRCTTDVPPIELMCRHHWHMVPRHMRVAVLANYIPGQEISKTPTLDYLEAAMEAINAVADAEGIAKV